MSGPSLCHNWPFLRELILVMIDLLNGNVHLLRRARLSAAAGLEKVLQNTEARDQLQRPCMQIVSPDWAWWLAAALSAISPCLYRPDPRRAGPDNGCVGKIQICLLQGASCLPQHALRRKCNAYMQRLGSRRYAHFCQLPLQPYSFPGGLKCISWVSGYRCP